MLYLLSTFKFWNYVIIINTSPGTSGIDALYGFRHVVPSDTSSGVAGKAYSRQRVSVAERAGKEDDIGSEI